MNKLFIEHHRGGYFLLPLHLRSLFPSYRSSRPEMFCKKDVYFAKFIGKPRAGVSFLIKLQVEHLQHCIVVVYIQRRIQNLAENLRWSLSAVNYFRKKLHLRCSMGFWQYIPDILVKNAAEKNESLGQYNTKSSMFEKKLPFGWDCWQISYL